jgi:hypothetical protein
MSPIAPDTDACALSGEPEPSYATNETPASRVRSRRASWVEPHGDPRLRLSIDPAGVPDAGLRSRLEAEFAKAVEREVLAGPGFALPAHGIARPDTKLDEEWASARNERQKQFVDWGITSERARNVALVVAYVELMELLNERVAEAAVDVGPIMDGGPETLTAFLERIPTAYTFACIEEVAIRNANHRWKPNDFHDLLMLSLGSVYCDVVVFEKTWSNLYAQSRAQPLGVVTRDLASLQELLIARCA